MGWGRVGVKWSWMRRGHGDTRNSLQAFVLGGISGGVAVPESKLLAGLVSSACAPRTSLSQESGRLLLPSMRLSV